MLIALQILLSLNLCYIIYQDFKDREVYWFLYALLFLVLGTIGLYTGSYSFEESVIACLFLLCQYLLVAAYYSVKNQKIYFSLSQEIGLGDVVYLISIAICCPFIEFISIYLIGAIAALSWFVLLRLMNKTPQNIPLAAFFCIAQLCFLFLEWVDCKKYFNLPINL